MQIEFKVNGIEHNMKVRSTMRLVDLLREELGLTGTKEGCGEGECGSCTVLMNGKAVNSCLILAPQIRNQAILTIEALEQDEELDILQASFIKNSAVQCGYCTPGMLMSAKALLIANAHPTEEEIKTAIAGNLCRCTGYNKIVKAIKEVADDTR